MELGCSSTTRQWTLKCVGNQWTGDLTATCSSPVSSPSSSSVNFDQIVEKLSTWYQETADYVSSVPLGLPFMSRVFNDACKDSGHSIVAISNQCGHAFKIKKKNKPRALQYDVRFH
jgi:hypothetical protein